eukprot:923474-Rhodomonas_salina.1
MVVLPYGSQVTFNALFVDQEAAEAALQALDIVNMNWAYFGPDFVGVVDGPDVYAWTGQSTSDPLNIAPSGMVVDSVHFQASCLNSGCWVVDVTYTAGSEDSVNSFFLPKAVGDDSLSYDFSYTAQNGDWGQSAQDTFSPNTHPCTSADYDAAEGLTASVSSCCLEQFFAMYRPTSSFWSAAQNTVSASCGTGPRKRVVDRSATWEVSATDLPGDYPSTRKGVFLSQGFMGMNTSHGVPAGVVDPFVGIFKARFFLDEVELRTLAGVLKGTVGVEHTVD